MKTKKKPTRREIVREIQAMAAANGGKIPARETFARESGIPVHYWRGVFWSNWSEALQESGFKRSPAWRTDEELLDEYGKYALELKRLPTAPDLRLRSQKKRTSKWGTYSARFGGRDGLHLRLRTHWKGKKRGKEILKLCANRPVRRARGTDMPIVPGYVYLMRCGELYKIGKAENVEVRYKELVGLVPQELVILHRIKTDDSYGVETYWHKRFRKKWVKGEWYRLEREEVKVFCRRGVM